MTELAIKRDAALFAEHVLGIQLDPWQAKALRSKSDQIIMNVHRQAGKSTIAAIMALHDSLYRPRSTTLVVSRSQRQSRELFKKIVDMRSRIEWLEDPLYSTTTSMDLTNGNRIISVPGSEETIRGYSAVTLLLIDEAARVSDDLYHSVRPMLAVSRGRVVLMSTPFGKRGFFYTERNTPGWDVYEAKGSECPRLDPTFLARERERSDWWYRQEYECEFVETDDQLFRSDDVESVFGNAEVEVLVL
jgi:hypothetical protein